ncbi:hypothetical protein K438DRAFT_1789704 [Mycena galopus ATCC 62051]|nr:hypothetical protein K438DRAFT_1789704 [Mycena galopus ATCC 62051]
MPLLCHGCGHTLDWGNISPPDVPTIAAYETSPASHRAALAGIENEIERFKSFAGRYISKLLDQRKDLETRLESVVYPVLSLPLEITSSIFVECLPNQNYYLRPSNNSAPLLLMKVCRQWKEIALSTCELWSSLDIILDNVEGAELLDISAILHRVQCLQMNFPEHECQRLVPSNTALPALQFLVTKSSDADLEDLLKNAPLLTEFSWTRASEGAFDFRCFASIALTKLTIWSPGFSVTEFIGILQTCPSLSMLTCSIELANVRQHRAPLMFPNLQDLRVFAGYTPVVPSIHALELLTLPYLSTFACESCLNPDVIAPFLSRSGSACIIRDLTCQMSTNGSVDEWKALGMFPFVETLDMTFDIGLAEVLQRLDTEGPSPLILPKLQHITLTYNGDVAPNYHHIIEIVRRRATHADTAELEFLHIVMDETLDCNWYPGDALAAELRDLILGGLDFAIEMPDGGVWPDLAIS